MSNSASTILRPLAHDIRNHAAVAKGFLGIALSGETSSEILGEIQAALGGIDSTLALLEPFMRAQAIPPSATLSLTELCTSPFRLDTPSQNPAGSILPARLALALEYFTKEFTSIYGTDGDIPLSVIHRSSELFGGLQIGAQQELRRWHAPDSKNSPPYPKLRLALAQAILPSIGWHLQIGTSSSELSAIRLLRNDVIT